MKLYLSIVDKNYDLKGLCKEWLVFFNIISSSYEPSS